MEFHIKMMKQLHVLLLHFMCILRQKTATFFYICDLVDALSRKIIVMWLWILHLFLSFLHK